MWLVVVNGVVLLDDYVLCLFLCGSVDLGGNRDWKRVGGVGDLLDVFLLLVLLLE